jgi:glucose-1-phosphate adenylyltransferase
MRQIPRRRLVSQLTRSTVAVVMAGGRGQRLMQLTDQRAKPATPFGGKYRIIDFSLSNCVNSGIRQIFILTQYKAHSLIQHVQRGWGYLHGELGEFIEIVPAQQQLGEMWYRGTADAVYQNLDMIRQHRPENVLILAGDHVYKMDYGPLLAFHQESGADMTIGGVQVPISQAHEFGVMTVGPDHRVVRFDEKPKEPRPMPGREGIALVSMGIYVITPEFMREALERNAARPDTRHDSNRSHRSADSITASCRAFIRMEARISSTPTRSTRSSIGRTSTWSSSASTRGTSPLAAVILLRWRNATRGASGMCT